MAYDSQGNYVKSAGELVNYLDSGAEFRDPTLINTNSILDMEAIYPVNNANFKSNNTINSIATTLGLNGGSTSQLITIGVWGIAIAFGIKMLMKR